MENKVTYSIKYIKTITDGVFEFELTCKGVSKDTKEFTLHVSPFITRFVGNYSFSDLRIFTQHYKEQGKIEKLISDTHRQVSKAISIFDGSKCIEIDGIKKLSQI